VHAYYFTKLDIKDLTILWVLFIVCRVILYKAGTTYTIINLFCKIPKVYIVLTLYYQLICNSHLSHFSLQFITSNKFVQLLITSFPRSLTCSTEIVRILGLFVQLSVLITFCSSGMGQNFRVLCQADAN